MRKVTYTEILEVFAPKDTSAEDAKTARTLASLNAQIRKDKRENLSSDAILRAWTAKAPKHGARVRTIMHLIEKRLRRIIARCDSDAAEVFDTHRESQSVDCTPEGMLTLAAFGTQSPLRTMDECGSVLEADHKYMLQTYGVLMDMFSGWTHQDVKRIHSMVRKWCADAVNNPHHCEY